MATDWNNPVLGTPYAAFLDILKQRDVDSGTLFLVDPTNPPVGVIRFNRGTNTFQEWSGTAWVDKVISQAGGGTGSNTMPPLGTMASQNANNVNITGGTVIGLNELRVNGLGYVAGQFWTGNTPIQLTDAAGRIIDITANRFASLHGGALTNLNASALATGTVYRDRLGSGAAGDGSRVLLDNGTWVPKNQVGGGMYEIVHNDIAMGTGDLAPVFNIPWTRGVPPNLNYVSVDLHWTGSLGGSSATWKVINSTQFQVFLTANLGAFTIGYTAFWHNVS